MMLDLAPVVCEPRLDEAGQPKDPSGPPTCPAPAPSRASLCILGWCSTAPAPPYEVISAMCRHAAEHLA